MMGLLGEILGMGNRARKRIKGLLSDPANEVPYALEQGLLGPWREGTQALLNYAQPAAPGSLTAPAGDVAAMGMQYGPQMIVWHGSPHKFAKFDASKIGTGEGAQAYGHGVYLAESPKVADEYAGKLSSPLVVTAAGKSVKNLQGLSAQAQDLLKRMQTQAEQAQYGSRMENAEKLLWAAQENVRRELIGNAPRWKATEIVDSGNLYKVDLPDSMIARMLDWDKPLSQQAPEVRAAMAAALEKRKPDLARYMRESAGLDEAGKRTLRQRLGLNVFDTLDTGGAAYQAAGQRGIEDVLRQAGIPGIRYLDGGSRGAGAGTSNFVVFPGEEGLLKILERNGMPVE